MKYKIEIICENEKELTEIIQKIGTQHKNKTLDQNNTEPATPKQLNLMEKLKIPIPDKCTKTQASDMIEHYFEKQKQEE
jgi:hypothetical protein